MISAYRSRGMNISRILVLLKIPGSTFYFSPPTVHMESGRKRSSVTKKITASGIIVLSEQQLLQDITDLLGMEFVCYGYKKVTKYLQRSGYLITGRRSSA